MNENSRRLITLLLALIAIILVSWNISYNNKNSSSQISYNQEPTYTSINSSTVIYNQSGNLSYKLISNKITYFSNEEVTWFDDPMMIIYDKNKISTWSIYANKAKLTKDYTLYLHGHVEVNSLIKDSQLKRINTDNAQINLTTQDVQSDDQVTLYGNGFNFTGMKMRGNLRTETAELIEKVQTYYEINM